MGYYIKATIQVADALGVTAIRNKTKDGHVLLWQADVASCPGVTFKERAAYTGGIIIDARQAKRETDGTEYPAEGAYTPTWFGGEGKTEQPEQLPAEPEQPADADEDTGAEEGGDA